LEEVPVSAEESSGTLTPRVPRGHVIRLPPRNRLFDVFPERDRKPSHRSEPVNPQPEIDIFIRVEAPPTSSTNPLVPREYAAENCLDRNISKKAEVRFHESSKEAGIHDVGIEHHYVLPTRPRES